jgi:hypothetical protein
VGHEAFISYRHGAEAEVAAAVERGLERLARPWNRIRAMSVFRDDSDLAAKSDLTRAITDALDETRFLVLIASPQSAASKWVDKEIVYWCDERRAVDRLIIVVADGEFAWDEEAGELTAASTAVSDAVRSRLVTEPVYVDLRWARSATDLSMRDSRFRSAIVRISATIRDVAPADLESEDVRLHRRARRLARAAVASVVVLALVASLAAVVAVANARRADRRAREALGRQLGLAALDLPASEADEALLLSLVAADLDSGDRRFDAARALIGRYSRLDEMLYAPGSTTGIRGIGVSPIDSRIVATVTGADGSPALLTWTDETRSDPVRTDLPTDVGPELTFLPDGRALVGTPGGPMALTDDALSTSEPLLGVVAVDSVRALAATGSSDSIAVIGLGDGDAPVPLADAAGIVDLRHGTAAAAGTDALVVVTADGDMARSGDLGSDAVTVVGAGATADTAAVTASVDGITRWSDQAGRLVADAPVAVPGEIGIAKRLITATDGRHVLVVGSLGSGVLDLDTGEPEATDVGATGVVAVDPSGRYAAVGGARLAIWDLERGRPTIAVPLPVNAMAWSGPCDGRCRLATAGESLDVWDPASKRRVELLGQTNAQAVAISDDGTTTTVVSAGWGPTVAVWKLQPIVDDSGRRAVPADDARLTDPSLETTDLDAMCEGDLRATSPAGELVAFHRIDDGVTTVCTTTDGSMAARATINSQAKPVTTMAVDDAGDVAIGGGDGLVEQYPRTGETFATGAAIDVRLGRERADVVALSYRSGTVVAGIRPADPVAVARVFVWPIAAGGTPTQFETDHLAVPTVALLGPDAGHVAVAGRDRPDGPVTIQIWETATRRRLGRALGGLSGEIVILTGDDTELLAADSAGRAFAWALDRDPSREICAVVGRAITAEEWSDVAAGALGGHDYRPICDLPPPAATSPVTTSGS